MVSIIIPVYNSAKYLEDCLDSICEQTYKDLEILCVNDGSTDDSLKILKNYASKDERVIILEQKEPSDNAAKPRNLGLKNASGEYVLFLDADDFFESTFVEKMLNKAKSVNADIVICGADRFDQEIEKIVGIYEKIELNLAPNKEVFNYKDCPDVIFQIGDWVTWNKLYKRDFLIDNNIWYESIPISDDQYFVSIAVVLAKSIVVLDEIFVHYRFNTGVSQVDTQSKHPEASYKQFDAIVERLSSLRIYDEVKQSFINMAFRLMRWFFDVMRDVESMHRLYDEYANKTFALLGAEDLSSDYFYDSRIADWYELIKNNSFEEILFSTARGYNALMTTGILRFPLPYDDIKKGARVVLVGKGLAGRYWYVQLIMSEYAEVVAWVNSETEIPQDLLYDQIICSR